MTAVLDHPTPVRPAPPRRPCPECAAYWRRRFAVIIPLLLPGYDERCEFNTDELARVRRYQRAVHTRHAIYGLPLS